jgi:hypothetical protein
MTSKKAAISDKLTDFNEERFSALRNAHYHMAREAWFSGVNRFCNFLVLMAGTGVAVQITQGFNFSGNDPLLLAVT